MVNYLLNRKNLPVIGIMLFALTGFIPNGPLMLFPTVIVVPLLITTGLAFSGIKFKGSDTLAEIFALSLILSGFFILKSVGIRPSTTDENIYFYMAVNLFRGSLPYKDFFFAHPPGHLLFIAPFFAFGFNLTTAKLIPVLASTLSSIFIYLTFRHAGYKMAGLVFVFLYLFSYQILMGSTNLNGENLMVMFLAMSIYFASRGHYFFSGIASGFALTTGLYSVAGVITIGLGVCFLNKTHRCKLSEAARFWLGVVILVLVVFGSTLAIAGDSFMEGVFKYHFLKAPKSGRVDIFAHSNPLQIIGNYLHNLKIFLQEKILLRSFYFHSPIYMLATGYILYTSLKVFYLRFFNPAIKKPKVAAGKSKPFNRLDSLAQLGIIGTLLFILQFAAFNEFYDFYMVPMLLFTILPAGIFVIKMVNASTKYPDRGWLGLPVVIMTLWLSLPLSSEALRTLWPQEYKHQGEIVNYQWHDPIAFKPVAKLCKPLFYSDYRERGTVTPFYQHYIWNKSLGLQNINELASFIQIKSKPGATISGASNIAPLVALLSNVDMANKEADLNNKRFKTGLLTDSEFLQKAINDNLQFIISTPKSHFTTYLMQTNPLYKNRFKKVASLIDNGVLHHSKGFKIDVYEIKVK